MDQSADYIVAGAGSAGCVLARRLAQSGATVILLEAGGLDRTRLVRQPGMIAIFHNVPALKKRLDWGYYTAPQASALGRRIPQPRGRVLGGSGSINGMLFVRGNRKNYDDWAAAGCTGWSYADVLPSFKRLEDWEDGASALRGSGGPVKVTRQKDLTPASQAFIEALAATAGVKKIDDYNGESQEGATVFQRRRSVATPGWAAPSSRPSASSAARKFPGPRRSRTSRCTRCPGPIRSPTRTHRSGRRSTSAPP